MKRSNVVRVGLLAGCVAVVLAAHLCGPVTPGYAATRSFCGPNRSIQSFVGHDGSGLAPSLVARPGSVLAGRTPLFRVLNPGRREISYGVEETRRSVDGRWVEMQWPPSVSSGWVRYYVAPEAVSQCIGPPTWPKWPVGKYQWLLGVQRDKSRGLGEIHYLRATFRLRH
jgi:hypothetical protein